MCTFDTLYIWDIVYLDSYGFHQRPNRYTKSIHGVERVFLRIPDSRQTRCSMSLKTIPEVGLRIVAHSNRCRHLSWACVCLALYPCKCLRNYVKVHLATVAERHLLNVAKVHLFSGRTVFGFQFEESHSKPRPTLRWTRFDGKHKQSLTFILSNNGISAFIWGGQVIFRWESLPNEHISMNCDVAIQHYQTRFYVKLKRKTLFR